MAAKPGKSKQPLKARTSAQGKPVVKAPVVEKPRPAPARVPEREKKEDKVKTQPKPANRIVRWYRETLGELRKVSWPSIPEARRLTVIVLIVVASTGALLGLLDFIFSRLVALLVSL